MSKNEHLEKLGQRIKELRIKKGLSQEELAFKCGYKSRSTINKIESGINDIPQSKIKIIADALGTSPVYLMGIGTEETRNIYICEDLKDYPLIGSIACGTPILAEENLEGYVSAPNSLKADFCLRCKGDSMINARINDGDIVFIRQQPDVDDGEIAAVLIDDEATLKRLYHNPDGVTLVAENPAYAPMVFTESNMVNIRIIGKAIKFMSDVK